MKRAVFLDRDGTINVDRHYLSRPEEFVLIPGAGEALRRLADAGLIEIEYGGITVIDLVRLRERVAD